MSAVKWWHNNKEAINIMGSLKALRSMWSANQFEGKANRAYQMPMSIAMDALHKLSQCLITALRRRLEHSEALVLTMSQ